MSHLSLTHHAAKRLQQRGIPESILPLLIAYGEEEYDHQGTTLLYFNKRARQQIAKVLPQHQLKSLEHALNAYAVLGQDGAVVTVGHRTQRIHHH